MDRWYNKVMLTPEEKRIHQRDANKRWRERNPEKVKEADSRPRHRIYNPIKTKIWRIKRLANPEYRERLNREANIRATAIRAWIDSYKLSKGCVDCGYKIYPKALHFDHIKGKKLLNVCNSKSIAQAKQEIKKCVVRCANCHCVITHQRLRKLIEKSRL